MASGACGHPLKQHWSHSEKAGPFLNSLSLRPASSGEKLGWTLVKHLSRTASFTPSSKREQCQARIPCRQEHGARVT